MNVQAIYEGSDGEATKKLYAKLETLGAIGIIALNLFRACKASERAKKYRRRYKGAAYDKKNWSLKLLSDALASYTPRGIAYGIRWGWKEDPTQEFHKWVLYVDLPTGQVSFHAAAPLAKLRYHGEWDGQHISARRIVAYVDHVLNGTTPVLHIDIGAGNITDAQSKQISEHLQQTALF